MKTLSIALLTILTIVPYCSAGEIDPKTIYDKLDTKIYQDRSIDTGQTRSYRSSEITISSGSIHHVFMASSNTAESLSTNLSMDSDAAFVTPKLSLGSIASSNQTAHTKSNKSAD